MRRLSVFWQHFISYLLVLVVPFGIVVFLFNVSQQELIRKNTVTYYENMLNTAVGSTEAVLLSFSATEFSVEYSVWLRELFYSSVIEKQPAGATLNKTIARALAALTAQEPGYANVAVSLYGSSVVYSSSGSYEVREEFGDSPARMEYGFPFFRSEDGPPLRLYTRPNGRTQYLIYVTPVTNAYETSPNNPPKGDLNVAVDVSYLTSNSRRLLDDGLILAVQYRPEGEEGYALLTSPLPEDGEYRFIELPSERFPALAYTLYVPRGVYDAPLLQLRRTTLVSLSAVALLALLLMTLFAYLHYRPIHRLRDSLAQQHGGAAPPRNELDHIADQIEEMRRKYHEAETELSISRPLITHHLFVTLLYERYDPDVKSELQRLSVELDRPFFCVVAVSLPIAAYFNGGRGRRGDRESTCIVSAFNEACSYYMDRNGVSGYVCELSTDQFGIIANFEEEEALEAFLQELAKDCVTHFGAERDLPVRFAVGGICEDLTSVSRSFDEACRLLDQQIFTRRRPVRYYSEIRDLPATFYDYSAADEAVLLAAVKKGDTELACNVLQDVIDRNIQGSTLDLYSAKCLHYQILSTLIKAIRQLGYRAEAFIDTRAVAQMRDFSEIHRFLEGTIGSICARVLTGLESDAPLGFEEQVIDYVRENLYKNTLSLQCVADHFRVSMSYISQVFKANTGTTYSEYVNKSRVARAMELRQSSGLTFTQISALVGYDSITTFRRNFVKFTGTTPASFGKPEAGEDSRRNEMDETEVCT